MAGWIERLLGSGSLLVVRSILRSIRRSIRKSRRVLNSRLRIIKVQRSHGLLKVAVVGLIRSTAIQGVRHVTQKLLFPERSHRDVGVVRPPVIEPSGKLRVGQGWVEEVVGGAGSFVLEGSRRHKLAGRLIVEGGGLFVVEVAEVECGFGFRVLDGHREKRIELEFGAGGTRFCAGIGGRRPASDLPLGDVLMFGFAVVEKRAAMSGRVIAIVGYAFVWFDSIAI